VSIRLLSDVLSQLKWFQLAPFHYSLLWSMLASFFFYATGHTPDFNSIPFSVAFIGYDTYNYWIGFSLIMLNIWGPHILWTLFLPTLLSQPLTETKKEEIENIHDNLSDLDEKRQSLAERTFQLFSSYMLVHSLYTLATMSFNFIARRHLMVKPHFLFLSCNEKRSVLFFSFILHFRFGVCLPQSIFLTL
jgi:hypothetical protein